MFKKMSEDGCVAVVVIGLVVALLLLLVGIPAIWSWSTGGEETITLSPQRITAPSGGVSHYKVWGTTQTGNEETFSVENEFWRGYNYSPELYAKLEPGHVYHVLTTGYRVGWLGWFKNIYKAEEVKPSEAK